MAERPGWRSGLGFRLSLIVLLAALPGFVLAFLAASTERRDAERRAEREAREIVDAAVAAYESLLGEAHVALRAMAAVPAIREATTECPPALRSLLGPTDTLAALFVATPDGDTRCLAAGPDAVDLTRVPSSADGDADELAVTSVERSPGTERALLALLRAPAPRGTGPDAIVGAQLRLDPAHIVRDARVRETTLVVLDADDVVLSRSPDAEGYTGQRVAEAEIVAEARAGADDADTPASGSRSVTADGIDGRRRLYVYEPLDLPAGALLYAGIPTDVAFGDATARFRYRVLGLSVAAALVLGVALLAMHRTVSSRIRALVDMARRLGRRQLRARSNVGGHDEIAELGSSLDAMAAELQQLDAERARLLGAVVIASEEERRRIAGDVHDDSIQVMAAHVMGLQLLRRRTRSQPEIAEALAELERSGRAATARLRELVFDLYSPILEDRGLAAGLRALLDHSFAGTSVRHEVDVRTDDDPAPVIRDTAYRVAQEAIANARRHADATHVRVELRRDTEDLVMRITDDGNGFSAAAVDARPGHLGLRAARERAAAVGGAVVVETAPGRGTVVVCRLPWTLESV